MKTKPKELEVTVGDPYNLSIQLKKWYTGKSNVVLKRDGSRKFVMEGFTEKYDRDERDELLVRFMNMGRWTHRMVTNELKKLNLDYPMKVKRKI